MCSLQPKPQRKTRERSRCPNCRKRGGMCVPSSERTPEGRIRHRHCRLCGYLFDTVMHLPLECPHCDAFDNFRCIKTRNIFGGILRTYRCRECMKYVPTYEAFPVPEESRRKPDLRNYD